MGDFILVAETFEEGVRYLRTSKGNVTHGEGEKTYHLDDFPEEEIRKCNNIEEFVLNIVESGPVYLDIWIDGKCYTRCKKGLLIRIESPDERSKAGTLCSALRGAESGEEMNYGPRIEFDLVEMR